MKDNDDLSNLSTRTCSSTISKIAEDHQMIKWTNIIIIDNSGSIMEYHGVSWSWLDYHLIDQVNIMLSSTGNKIRSNTRSIVPNVINNNINEIRVMENINMPQIRMKQS